jgi:DNA-binding IclR family transcriptional regulator
MGPLKAPRIGGHVPRPRSKTVQSVDRALALLRVVADSDGDMTLGDLALRCNIERPTAWRLLWTLESNGLVEKVEPAHYRLALGWQTLSGQHAVDSLIRLAHPVLQELADEHQVTASLVHVKTLRLEYVDHVDGALFTSPRWDTPLSLHASSPGKAVLAALPDAEWRAMVGDELSTLTETTITHLDEFTTEIEQVRTQGYAVCHGEDVTYSNGASAAVLLHGRPIAAIDLWGPDRRVVESRLHDLGKAAAAAATRVATAVQPS